MLSACNCSEVPSMWQCCLGNLARASEKEDFDEQATPEAEYREREREIKLNQVIFSPIFFSCFVCEILQNSFDIGLNLFSS